MQGEDVAEVETSPWERFGTATCRDAGHLLCTAQALCIPQAERCNVRSLALLHWVLAVM